MTMLVIGGLYRHYKGNMYVLLFVGQDSNNDCNQERVAVYMSLDDPHKGAVRTRHVTEFMEDVQDTDGKWVPRFAFVGNPS